MAWWENAFEGCLESQGPFFWSTKHWIGMMLSVLLDEMITARNIITELYLRGQHTIRWHYYLSLPPPRWNGWHVLHPTCKFKLAEIVPSIRRLCFYTFVLRGESNAMVLEVKSHLLL